MPHRRRGKETRVDLPEVDGFVWHGVPPRRAAGAALRLPRARPVRARRRAHRCNPGKLLLDPYAKAIDGQIDGDPSLFGYDFGRPGGGLDDIANTDDSLGKTMTSVVINPFFDWGQDRPPAHEYHETVIYEAHVKGLTKLHPDVPEEIRGTYAGIAPPRR